MLSEAKHPSAHRERPFASLRVTNYYRSWLGNFIIGQSGPMMNMNKGSPIRSGDGLRCRTVILRLAPVILSEPKCMDHHHHHQVSHHRTMMVEAPLNGLEAVDTM